MSKSVPSHPLFDYRNGFYYVGSTQLGARDVAQVYSGGYAQVVNDYRQRLIREGYAPSAVSAAAVSGVPVGLRDDYVRRYQRYFPNQVAPSQPGAASGQPGAAPSGPERQPGPGQIGESPRVERISPGLGSESAAPAGPATPTVTPSANLPWYYNAGFGLLAALGMGAFGFALAPAAAVGVVAAGISEGAERAVDSAIGANAGETPGTAAAPSTSTVVPRLQAQVTPEGARSTTSGTVNRVPQFTGLGAPRTDRPAFDPNKNAGAIQTYLNQEVF